MVDSDRSHNLEPLGPPNPSEYGTEEAEEAEGERDWPVQGELMTAS